MSSSVDQIKSKLDIVTLIGGYVKLEKSGSSFKGRCPFHNEKTPSFFVSPDRGSYYCFGCQAKGDIFTFVQEFEGLDFKGALKVLADRAGVTLEKFSGTSSEEKNDKDTLLLRMDQAAFYFEKNLSEYVEATDYLKDRGVSEETIQNFRIGYALPEWRGLHDFLISKGATVVEMERAGLVKQGEKGTVYDTFRSRIIFPISDSSGRVVAFSGRIFPNDPDAPKYLNSPETPIFHKSEMLFGLDKAKRDIHRLDYSILVEGQMDLIMLHQVGLHNTVASSGTALTVEHLTRLNRLSSRLIMAFDGDAAGFKAIVRGAEIALSLGMEVKVAVMPKGVDPADMAVQDKDRLLQTIREAKHIISFVLDLTIAEATDARVVARKVASGILPFVSRLASDSEKAHFIKEINARTGITENALWEDLRKVKKLTDDSRQTGGGQEENQKKEKSDLILEKLFGILFWQERKDPPEIDVADMEKKISDVIGSHELSNFKTFYFQTREALVFQSEAYYTGHSNLSSDILELTNNLYEEKLKREQIEITAAIRRAQIDKNDGEVHRLSVDFNELAKRIQELKNKTIEK